MITDIPLLEREVAAIAARSAIAPIFRGVSVIPDDEADPEVVHVVVTVKKSSDPDAAFADLVQAIEERLSELDERFASVTFDDI